MGKPTWIDGAQGKAGRQRLGHHQDIGRDSGALKRKIGARAAKTATWGLRFLILAGTGLVLVLLIWAARPIRRNEA